MYLGLLFWVSRKKTGGFSSQGIQGILCSICSNNYISRKIPRLKDVGIVFLFQISQRHGSLSKPIKSICQVK